MDADLITAWQKELESARQQLTSLGADASIRGEGHSLFLFVKHEGRAVEICGDADGSYNVEVWERDCDGSDHDVDVPGITDAIKKSRAWLLP